MDNVQTNHLKAYGIAFLHLENGNEIEWLLNYRGGSFLMDNQDNVENTCLVRGVNYELINSTALSEIFTPLNQIIWILFYLKRFLRLLFISPGKQHWDDAVTLALTFADIKYDVVFDDEVMSNKINDYDWLHLHHEDFTGQYGKFYRSYRNKPWYKKMESDLIMTATKTWFSCVHNLKKFIALKIKKIYF